MRGSARRRDGPSRQPCRVGPVRAAWCGLAPVRTVVVAIDDETPRRGHGRPDGGRVGCRYHHSCRTRGLRVPGGQRRHRRRQVVPGPPVRRHRAADRRLVVALVGRVDGRLRRDRRLDPPLNRLGPLRRDAIGAALDRRRHLIRHRPQLRGRGEPAPLDAARHLPEPRLGPSEPRRGVPADVVHHVHTTLPFTPSQSAARRPPPWRPCSPPAPPARRPPRSGGSPRP
jgi:hypothetical protein